MGRIPVVTLDEWKVIGMQSQKARAELLELIGVSNGKVPARTIDILLKTLDRLDQFRSMADDRMFDTGVSDDMNIFYG
jgi:hypothetical protein